ncbi:MAG: hypothetical protein WA843_01270 [Candidatus Saccharimonadales bacterium]
MLKALNIVASLGVLFAALSSSTNFQLNSYSVGSGSTNNSSSATYNLQASTGQINGAPSSSTTYTAKSGAIQAEQANVPTAPTLSNGGGTYFNQLNFIITTANNASDAVYSVAVSTTSNFTVTNYVQADGTLGATPVYQTYAAWGGASGTLAVGLSASTAYWFKVDAIQGKFTASAYGLSATASTVAVGPTLSFALTPSTINLGPLLANSIVASPSNISVTFATNAAHGGTVYVAGQNTGLVSASSSNYNLHVTPPSGDLSSLSEGFGLKGLSASSPLTIQSPYNGSGNVVGAIFTTFQPLFSATAAVSSGSSTATLLAKSSISTPSATDYQDTLTFVAAASY